MSLLRWLVRRLSLAVGVLWAVFTLTFLLVVLSGDPGEAQVQYAVAQELAGSGASREEIEAEMEAAASAYREARNLDVPIHERYLDWMGNVLTLDLGIAYSHPQPVTSLLADRILITLAYVIPGLALGVVGGVLVGTYAAFGRRRRLAELLTVGSYGLFAIPNFWLALVAMGVLLNEFNLVFLTGYDIERSVFSEYNLRRLVLPSLLVATVLIAEQARYVRSELLENDGELYVKQVRSKGVTEWRVARHVLRVSFVPLFSLFVSSLLGVLVLNVFVIEFVFQIPGFGLVSYDAIIEQDLPVIVGMTLVVAVVGVAATFLQDLAWMTFDPRSSTDDE